MLNPSESDTVTPGDVTPPIADIQDDSLSHLEDYIKEHFNENNITNQPHNDVPGTSAISYQPSAMPVTAAPSLEEVDPAMDEELLALANQIDSQTSGFGGGGSFTLSSGGSFSQDQPTGASFPGYNHQTPQIPGSSSFNPPGLPLLSHTDVAGLASSAVSNVLAQGPAKPPAADKAVFSATHHLKHLASSVLKHTPGPSESAQMDLQTKTGGGAGALLRGLPVKQLHSVKQSSDSVSDSMGQKQKKVTSNEREEGAQRQTILMDVLMRKDPEKQTQDPLPSSSAADPGEGTSSGSMKHGKFHVDKTKLSAVPMSQQSSDLTGLGLTVYNQDDLEQGIMGQLDEAMEQQEMERKKQQWEKEVKAVQDDIQLCKAELQHIEKVRRMLLPGAANNNKQIRRKLDSVNSQRQNKLKQVKKLKAKARSLAMKLDGNFEGLDDEEEEGEGDGPNALESALGMSNKTAQSEVERMIRLGEMTPFGTNMAAKEKKAAEKPKAPKVMLSESSPFDKYLLDQESKRMSKGKTLLKKQKSSESSKDPSAKSSSNESKSERHSKKAHKHKLSSADSSNESSNEGLPKSKVKMKRDSDSNFFTARDKRSYRPAEKDFSNYRQSKARGFHKLQHNFSGDGALSDHDGGDQDEMYEESQQSDGEYRPDREEWVSDDEDDKDTPWTSVGKKKRQQPKRRKEGDWFTCEGEEVVPGGKKKKKSGGRSIDKLNSKDDGDYDMYEERIRVYRKEQAKKRLEKLESGEAVSEDESDEEFEGGFKVPGKIWNKLYKYQRTGVTWLWELHIQQAGGIVGDEMGLGKTVQIAAFLAALQHSGLRDKGHNQRYRGLGPTLIVVPTTVMHQWVKELHKWAPMFRVAVLHNTGTYQSSEETLVYNMVKHCGVLVTAYSSVLIYQDLLLQYDWHYVILDEGHKIRNPDAQITVACKQFRTCHRIILSGSPIQNNLKELWSLFDFVFPGKLGTMPDFMAHFSVPIVQGGYANATQVQVQTAYKCACVLRDTIAPYLIRRMKSDVKESLQLPDKNEQVLFCRLTEHQKDVYQEYLESRECAEILRGNFMVFPGLITLRKICNHPDLSTGGPSQFDPDYNQLDEQEKSFGFWKRSGKMIVVESLLKLWFKQGHRVLLFSQGTQMLNLLEKFVQLQGFPYMRMDGGTSIGARQGLIEKFNKNENMFLFLLTTRVGGLGVNLCGANRVIIFDPDWNPSTDTQARERAWRIGQTRQVTIYRLLTTGTIEEKIYHRQIFKQFLTNRVLKDPKQRRFFKSNDLFELFTLTSDDPDHGTETGAIFAGTGSEVTVKVKDRAKQVKVSKKRNRFDEMKARGDETNFDDDLDEDESKKKSKEEEERREKMREFARKLSQQLEREKKEMAEKAENQTENSNDAPNVETSEEKKAGNVETFNENSLEEGEIKKETDSGLDSKDDNSNSVDMIHTGDIKMEKPSSSQEENNIEEEKIVKEQKKHKKHKKDKHKDKHKKDKKKKKRQKDAVFEGEKIAYLARHSTYKKSEEEEKQENQKGDDFVLEKLFKKSGVHSALQHDTIMQSSNPDYALVEGEADRVAREAASALKRSRSQCHRASSGIPTWTGSSGAVRSSTPTQNKPRFGQKKNAKIVEKPKEEKKPPATVTSETPAKKPKVVENSDIFHGKVAGNVKISAETQKSSAPNIMSSTELLSRMRHRNNFSAFSANQVTGNNEEEEEETGSSNPVQPDDESMEFITDIRNYIAFGARVDGQASTQELLDEFSAKIPSSDSAKFRAMLKEICSFRKNEGMGVWKLKPEFR